MIRRRLICSATAMLVASVPLLGFADEYSDGWGPAVGSQIPLLEARDQDGTPRVLANLAGEQGLLLFLNRSADW